MKKNKLVIIIVCIFFYLICFISCKNNFDASSSEILTIGTYNMEWLGDGINDQKQRNDDVLNKIANMLSTLDADIIGVQEVENDAAMESVVSKMSGYDYYVCQLNNGSKQRVGVIYKKNIRVNNLKTYTPLLVPEFGVSLRPGLICNVEKNGMDFLCMFIHLKATSRFDDTPEKVALSREIRTQQNQILANFVDSINQITPKTKIILLGDFNDTPKRKQHNTMASLTSNSNIHFLTTEQKSCKYPTAYTIDHIVVNSPAKEKYIDGSLFQLNIFNMFSQEDAKNISDHCPILVKFNVSKN